VNSKLFVRMPCILFLCASTVKAGIFIDPYLGYGMGEFSLESSIGTNESDVEAPVLGLRLGYGKGGFFIGTDLMFQFETDFEPSLNDPNLPLAGGASRNGDASHGSVFLTAGFKPPILPFRFYAGWALFSSYKLKFSGGEDIDFEGKGGYKLGIGYKPGFLLIRLPISLNLEYLVEEFDEATGVGTIGGNTKEFPFITGQTPNLIKYNDAELKTIMITVSAPFTFFD